MLSVLAVLALLIAWIVSSGGGGDKNGADGSNGKHPTPSTISPGPSGSGPAISQAPGGRDESTTGGDTGGGSGSGSGSSSGTGAGTGAARAPVVRPVRAAPPEQPGPVGPVARGVAVRVPEWGRATFFRPAPRCPTAPPVR